MKTTSLKLLLLNLALMFSACIMPASAHSGSPAPSVKWELLPPEESGPRCVMRFTVHGLDSISRLCFTQLPRPGRALSPADSLVEINAGYYYVTSPLFGTSAPEAVIDIECKWPLRAVAESPGSFHALSPSGTVFSVEIESAQTMSEAAVRDEKWLRWMLPADSIYHLNERLVTGRRPGPFDIAPSFKKVVLTEGIFTNGLLVRTKIIEDARPEFYRITLSPDGALIEGVSPQAVAMGRRMLERRILEPTSEAIPCAVIEDWPDYPYRGLMIDIARNYQTPETLHRMAELMADYRFNRLHFHLTDDEAWRLEIPGLPELTEVGARRGFTLDSKDFLPDVFAGSGNPDNNLPTANGYFTREEFIDFIRHCDSLGIAVIPEVESPGHARAAIKAMEARFRISGDDTYRLIEPGDTSRYSTAQNYHDNLMNPAVDGTYRFIAKVVDEIAAMYRQAGVDLPGIHLGGDEVPNGAWDGSKAATEMAARMGVSGRHGLQGEYVRRIAAIMKERGIPLYGWQDICTDYDSAFHEEVAPVVGGMDCWVSPHNPEDNIAIKGVTAGYPVIISNVEYFYMDMLYSPHPDEKGLFWGGFVDELRTLEGYPSTICPPQEGQKGRVIGVSGKLFAETIRNPGDMQRLLFPKCLGLAERGWNARPTYSPEDFNILIGTKELPRFERLGVEWHLRQPGILIEDGMIHMNSPYPDAEIRYTTDGSSPSATSDLYTDPFPLPADSHQIRAILVKDNHISVPTIAVIE